MILFLSYLAVAITCTVNVLGTKEAFRKFKMEYKWIEDTDGKRWAIISVLIAGILILIFSPFLFIIKYLRRLF